MVSPPPDRLDPSQHTAARVLSAVASIVGVLVIVGLVFTGVSADALRTADSMRQFLDHLIEGDRLTPGAILLASSVAMILLAPIVTLFAVVFVGARLRRRNVLLALGVFAVTGMGVVLAFL